MRERAVNERWTRRAMLRAGAGAAAVLLGGRLARGKPADAIRIGLVDPFSGVYAAIGRSESDGARLAVEEINAAGGVLGRPLELLAEDSAARTDVGVQKFRKLVERDQVQFTMGEVSSGVSLALAQASHEFGIVHIVTGGHADEITGKDCKWNVFRVPTSATMEANAIGKVLADRFGKAWYIITPDYAYGWSLQESFSRVNRALGGRILGADRVPLGTSDYSAQLLKAARAKPDVLVTFQAGDDAVAILKQIAQFGLHTQMAVAGGLQEWENIMALPPEARIGWWTFEWYWIQPDVPEVKAFVEEYRKRFDRVPTARSWFGYASVHGLALAIQAAGDLDARKVARALEGLVLPRKVALQPHKVYYRPGDHQLTSGVFVGHVRQGKERDDIFELVQVVPGEEAAPPIDQTGCRIVFPA
ncbi:MAG: ABC transporter substrate-binding protein [Limnochordaceae bacterium]|nr:ABC transporter substrate-binding protein [Limnochordaceae bacterium]